MINNSVVDAAHFKTCVGPLDIVDFRHTQFVQTLVHCRVFDDRIDGIGHGIDIPVIGLDGMLQDLCAA